MLLFIGSQLFAQNQKEVLITGSILAAEDATPLEQATLKLLSLPDSTFIKGTVATEKGRFLLSNKGSGPYLLSISFIGFETIYKRIAVPDQGDRVDIGTVKLSQGAIDLGEIIALGKAPEMVVKEDTVEHNAASYKLEANAVVEDLIKQLPGVELGTDGAISVGGKTVKRILVNGKEFFGEDTKVATKNINVEIVEKLQVIDRKSDEARLTGVDDGDDEVVINLTIKKGMNKGWFGNASAAYGNDDRFEVGGMANRFVESNQYSLLGGINNTNNAGFSDLGGRSFSGSSMRGSRNSGGSGSGNTTAGSLGTNFNVGKTNDFRVGGNLLLSGSDQDETKVTHRENYRSSGTTYYDQAFDAVNRSRNISGDFKLEWKIDSLTRLEFQPSIGLNHTESTENALFSTKDSAGIYLNRGVSENQMSLDGVNVASQLTFTRASASRAGRRMSVSFNFGGNYNEGVSYINSHTIYGDSLDNLSAVRDTTIQQRQTENSTRNSYRTRVTYVEPFGNKRFLQLSYRINSTISDSKRYSYNREAGSDQYSTEYDSLYSDRFRNTAINQTIGASIRTVREKYNYTVGINVDPSISKSLNYFDEERSYNRTIVNYSPSVDFSYLWDKRTSMRIQYRGRTQQPSINQLQPSKNITNPLVVREGNLNLNPSYTNSLSVRYNKYDPKSQFTIQATLQGNIMMNSIVNQTLYNDETGVQTTKPINVNGVWNSSGGAIMSMPLSDKRFQINNNINLGYTQQVGFADGEKNISRNYSIRENAGITYRSKLIDLGVRGNYTVSRTTNSLASRQDQRVMNYGGTANTTLHLPANITLGSDFSYVGKAGYSSGFNIRELLWNAHATVAFLKNKKATGFFRIYDILQQRNNISQRITANYLEDVRTNILTQYFLVGFSYRFNNMAGGNNNNRGGGNRDRSGRSGGGGGFMSDEF